MLQLFEMGSLLCFLQGSTSMFKMWRHDTKECLRDSYTCPDINCSIYQKYELINCVMALCDVSQFIAKRQIKNKNICNFEQVKRIFKSPAYLAWDNTDILSNYGVMENSSIPSISNYKVKSLSKRKLKSNKFNSTATSDRDQFVTMTIQILRWYPQQIIMTMNCPSNNIILLLLEETAIMLYWVIVAEDLKKFSILKNYSHLRGVIIKDIYDIFKANKPVKERDSAVLNYIKLLFQK